MRFRQNRVLIGAICLVITTNLLAQETLKKGTLTNDGAWCWFSEPRAIYTHNEFGRIITGWVTEDGSIEAASLNLDSEEKHIQLINPKIDKDDHANPSFLELENKDILLSYAKHFDAGIRFHRLTPDKTKFGEEKMVSVYDEEQFKLYPRKTVTYSNPIALSKENGRVYCFGRWTGYKPNMIWSDDNGKSFSSAKVFITNIPFKDNNRPYVRYYSDGESRIHIVFTDGHPRKEPTNSVYYAYYENGAFWRIDGTKICSLSDIPFEPNEASVVYKASEESGRAWVHDVTTDKKGNPVILYARYPKETEHLYHRTYFDGKEWNDQFLCNSGKWFPQTPENGYEREPHYSGGMAFHPLNPNIIYLSREVNDVFEIEKWSLSKKSGAWKKTPVTMNSEYDNVRPIVPKNMHKKDKTVVLWMVNEKYIHYTDYKTRIDYLIED